MKNLIFDNEDVIVKSDWNTASNIFFNSFNLEISLIGNDFKDFLNSKNNRLEKYSVGLMNFDEFWSDILLDLSLNNNRKNRLIAANSLYNLTQKPNYDLVILLSQLKMKGYPLFMLSNCTYEINCGNMKRDNYFDLFNGCYFSYQIGSRKPDVGNYSYLLNDLRLNPKNCVFIDDKKRNTDVANDLGLNVINYHIDESVENLIDEFKKYDVNI